MSERSVACIRSHDDGAGDGGLIPRHLEAPALGALSRSAKILVGSLFLLLIGGSTSSAIAEVHFAASVQPGTFNYPGKRALTFRLRMRSGDAAERFSIDIRSPRFHRSQYRAEGSPIRLRPVDGRLVQPAGAVTLGQVRLTHAQPSCSPTSNRPHGYEPKSLTVDASLPANTAGSLTVRYEVGGTKLWPGLQYHPTFVARRRLLSGEVGTLPSDTTISPRNPRLRARTIGVRIDFRTMPSSSPTPGLIREREIKRGRSITLVGSTKPVLRRKRISFKYVAPRESRLRALGHAWTDRRGRFRYGGWYPRVPGSYEVWAFYRRTRASGPVLSDHACPRAFTIHG
jgi:hypothetical protein